MAAGMTGDIDAPWIGAVVSEMLMEQVDGMAHLANDAVHPRFRRQGKSSASAWLGPVRLRRFRQNQRGRASGRE